MMVKLLVGEAVVLVEVLMMTAAGVINVIMRVHGGSFLGSGGGAGSRLYGEDDKGGSVVDNSDDFGVYGNDGCGGRDGVGNGSVWERR